MNIAVICGDDYYSGGGFQQELSTILMLKKYSNEKYNFIFYSTKKNSLDVLKKYNVKIRYIKITYLNKLIDDLRD